MLKVFTKAPIFQIKNLALLENKMYLLEDS